jgi:hypothetical protein
MVEMAFAKNGPSVSMTHGHMVHFQAFLFFPALLGLLEG